ncbi:NADH-quinone oxidoreductase subunit G [Solemya pervernicosa gill symbiont]|uniref:NADH-quinone oxidoreductase n=2 Tax=Gammaproteobacteria incertae sedis TaxID=118884 RepID=A0A1T2L9E6_9GAMM|nr:NADH-quinone oxidoreductase subunit NuoG [Candidatus Reidiella endopervernicosa]OOZ41729.1 NADH-quinone oxidoreductase subunit G [Solemya pervernicosa gill symbiont]QKQ26486.1 NADH-quinone oxidoreductase subunit G [Candidatus Reidiella endopervernicosa]
MSEEQVTIEVNGQPLQARKGAVLIEATDAAGITVPRFCYHKKLSVSANCRMCLVEVEKAPKPLPACATPVMEGMKVFTHSPKALSAQKGTMEFLLINHPLDCPICDQGGECELQDVAVGFGGDVARYSEAKRVVIEKDIGPLIATDMTRCIHCTRCVRFGAEIAGVREMGMTGRGDFSEIGTYIEKSLTSELSGNIIDLCPVGALTAKPSRYTARPWELRQFTTVAPHDSAGSNLHIHTRNGSVMRAVPCDNEEINETWISDRDRFSYQGVNSEERLKQPMVKERGEWRECDWETALERAAKGLKDVVESDGGEQFATLISPMATLEELYLAASLTRALGSNNIDHRLRQGDFSDQNSAPVYPWLGQSIAELEQLNAALLIGSNIRKEQPIFSHRLRKATLAGADVSTVNPVDFDFNFDLSAKVVVEPASMVAALAGIAKALEATGSAAVKELIASANVSDEQRAIAKQLKAAESATVLLGNLATAHPEFSTLRALAAVIAEQSGAKLGYLPEAGNSVGGWLAGAVPHRTAGGQVVEATGLDARAVIESPRKGYLLFNVEPGRDCWSGADALAATDAAECVVAATPFASDELKAVADVLLPIASFAETSGTYVNAEGRWQSFEGVTAPAGEARPGWKVLRVLGNLIGVEGFEFISSSEVCEQLGGEVNGVTADNALTQPVAADAAFAGSGLVRVGEVPIYAIDSTVRRSIALQQTASGSDLAVQINSDEASRLGLDGSERVKIVQGEYSAEMAFEICDRVADGAAWIPAGVDGSEKLGPLMGRVELERL